MSRDREVESVWMPGGVRTEIHLTGERTGGALCLLVDEPPADWALPTHRHRTEAETIHVVAGEFEIEVEGERFKVGAGETIHVPSGTRHAGRNVGGRPGRRVVIFSPAGIEGFFREVGRDDRTADVNLAEVIEVATRFGWEFG